MECVNEVQFGEIHPLDYDALEKGQVITAQQCERIFGISRRNNPTGYAFAVMGLCQRIEHERKDLVAVGKDYGIAVLTDPQAVEYLKSTYESLVSKMARLARRGLRIDPSYLTIDQVRTKDFYLMAAASSAADLKRELRKARDQERLLEMVQKPKALP